MPWLPEFVGAVELARRQNRAAVQAEPVGQYLTALTHGDADALQTVWPGEVVVYDPWAGEIRGHKALRQFVRRSQSWLAARQAQIQTMATTSTSGRAAVELLVHLAGDGPNVAWPLAVVAESRDDWSVTFRSYANQWPIDGQRHLRPPILESGRAQLGDLVGHYRAALAAGDVDAVLATFAPDGYYREAIGPNSTHRGTEELRSFFSAQLSAGRGITLEGCALTDDGVRCALEYNYVRWGSHDLTPQAGLGVFERAVGGLLAAARVYDDVEPVAGYV